MLYIDRDHQLKYQPKDKIIVESSESPAQIRQNLMLGNLKYVYPSIFAEKVTIQRVSIVSWTKHHFTGH